MRAWPQIIAGICTVAALIIGIEWGAFIAGGPDASGYVSEADKWAHGALVTAPPEWTEGATWENAIWSSTPVGYRPRATGPGLAPVYSPGVPLLMALFQLAGGRDAVFYVIPLLAAVAVWASYTLGSYLAGPWAGAIAAFWLVSSPVFLLLSVVPMSDVPVTACWAVALVFAWRGGTWNAIASGLATAAAILVRPNLVPLAVIPALLLMTNERGLRRLLAFGVATCPAALVIATLNAQWWGSPLKSGYGTLGELYSVNRILLNLRQYAGWLIDEQTPLVFVGFAAPFLVSATPTERTRVILLTVAYPIAVLAMYLGYLSFDRSDYLRFLMPAFPAVFAGCGAVLVEYTRRAWRPSMAIGAVAVLTISVGIQEWRVVMNRGILREEVSERRFARAVDFANSLPENAILLSDGYSGTLHFYTGRDVLRWGMIFPQQLDGALVYLRTRGHPLYFIGDPFEVTQFKQRFSGTDAVRELDQRSVPTFESAFVAYDLSK